MVFLQGPAVPWAVLVVQIAGIVSACLARFSEGCACQRFCQGLFFLCLALVATSAVISLRFEPDCWLTSGGILAAMVVAATFQFGPSRKAVAW
jgi:hypothetical protein